MKRFTIAALFIAIFLQLYGCQYMVASGVFVGAREIIHYASDNVSNRTMVGSLQHVQSAACSALERMQIEITQISEKQESTRIMAKAGKLNIKINMESITPNTTRITVAATSSSLSKDKATADEIIIQIGHHFTPVLATHAI